MAGKTKSMRQQAVAAKPAMDLEHKPPDKLFIDFSGKIFHYTDRHTGELIACEVFGAVWWLTPPIILRIVGKFLFSVRL